MDWAQWYAVGFACLYILASLLRIRDGQENVWLFLLGCALQAPIFGRVFGWW